ncbi:hypothetical protein [Alteromonas gracilis]|uniref:hypothetical protein n=1 Tax=Alteromonas gracilis TaxID=1479524 RepID=UPI003735F8BC
MSRVKNFQKNMNRAKLSVESGKLSNILLLITSPFQYLCAQEFLHQFGLSERRIIVVNGATFCDNSLRQIDRLHSNLVNVEEIKLEIPTNTSLEERIKPYAKLVDCLREYEFERVLVGDLREIWMQDVACCLSCSDIILVDDGAATNVLTEKLIAPNNFALPIALHQQMPSRKEEAERIKRKLGLFLENKNINLFSIFPFPQYENTSRNHLNVLRDLFNKHHASQKMELHFIGSPVIEKRIVSESAYFEFISHARRDMGDGQIPIYFAHRAENINSKRDFLEQLGFQVEFHEEPYELACAIQGRVPAQIFGMHSTSLFNMKTLFGGKIKAVCYKINDDALAYLERRSGASDKFSLREHIEAIYHRLDEFNIESRTLD